MASEKVLLVEDEKAHQLIISRSLSENFSIDVAGSYSEAQRLISDGEYDIFLLDIMLGDGLGFDLIPLIRGHEKFAKAPIVFLTSKEDIPSKVKGFSLGADDYVTKPCDPRELRARLSSKIKKYRQTQAGTISEYKIGDLTFDFELQRVSIAKASGETQEIILTPIEYKLLYYLVRNREDVLSREQILKHVWGGSTHVMLRSVDTYVATLRKKIKEYGVHIRSVHGVGYKLNLHPTQQAKAA